MCSVFILGLSFGVVLGVVGLYLIQRVRDRSSGPTSSSSPPPPLPPPDIYEEVDVAREVKRSQDIQLTSNEAYGPIKKHSNITKYSIWTSELVSGSGTETSSQLATLIPIA